MPMMCGPIRGSEREGTLSNGCLPQLHLLVYDRISLACCSGRKRWEATICLQHPAGFHCPAVEGVGGLWKPIGGMGGPVCGSWSDANVGRKFYLQVRGQMT